MNTSIIRLCQSHDDPVWGLQIIEWVTLPPIRVTRNRLQKAVFEWVDGRGPISPERFAEFRRRYPIAKYV